MPRFLLVACMLLFGGALACHAHAHPPASPGGPYQLAVESEYGAPLATYEKDGQYFVLGHYGERYVIVVSNHTGRRVEAVVTVDGRDVVSGQKGDYVRGRGYVLAAYASLRIEGFRKNLGEVAAFRFVNPGASYSSRMGTPENVGVIGAAFFPERASLRRAPALAPAHARAPAPSTLGEAEGKRDDAHGGRESAARESAAAPSAATSADRGAYDGYRAESPSNLGTEYGETRESQVEEVRFERASTTRPALVTTLRYDDRSGLLARGIELEPRSVSYYGYREPDPFPSNRFAPPPP